MNIFTVKKGEVDSYVCKNLEWVEDCDPDDDSFTFSSRVYYRSIFINRKTGKYYSAYMIEDFNYQNFVFHKRLDDSEVVMFEEVKPVTKTITSWELVHE